MNKLYMIYRNDTCTICNGYRSLELYDRFDKPLHYSQCIDRKEEKKLFYKGARYFKCKKCQAIFDIKWEDEIPRVAIDIDFLTFSQIYKNNSEGSN